MTINLKTIKKRTLVNEIIIQQFSKKEMHMKWIEVIRLRSVGRNREMLESKIQGLIKEVRMGGQNQVIMAYGRLLIHTDFIIHLYHDSGKVEREGSRLGLCLVNALEEYGLVNHSMWTELQGE